MGARARRRAGRRAARAVRGAGRRPAPGEQREAHAGRRPRDVHRPRCSTRTSTPTARPTTNRGHRASSIPERLHGLVTRLDAAGLQPHFHAIGDRAVRECPRRRRGGPRGERPDGHAAAHRPHPGRSTPTTCRGSPRSASSPTPSRCGPATRPRWTTSRSRSSGPERATWQYPFASLLRSGARLAMGSDWRVSTPDPLARDRGRGRPGLAATTRDRRRGEPFLPGRATHARARRSTAFTLGSAYVNHLDDDTGSIEVGKLADLAVDRPRPVRARRRPDRRRPRPRDVRRRRRPCSRIRRSAEAGAGAGAAPAANRRTTARRK